LNQPQELSAMHSPSPAAKYLGMRLSHDARLFHDLIVAKWNRFGIIANRKFFEIVASEWGCMDQTQPSTARASPTARTGQMIFGEFISRSSGGWRESRCSGLWCRSPTGEQSALSPNGQIPSTIPRSTSDGVSKCFLTPASGANGLRMGAAAPRLPLNIGCSPITSKNSAMAERRSTRATVNASAVPITPARPCKPGQTDGVLTEGGRGFISLEIDRPATAPTLMQRFFLAPGSFDFFSRNQIFKRRSRQFLSTKQGCPTTQVSVFEHLFSRRTGGQKSLSENCREIPGGGGGGS
jgi:hypothetical protein